MPCMRSFIGTRERVGPIAKWENVAMDCLGTELQEMYDSEIHIARRDGVGPLDQRQTRRKMFYPDMGAVRTCGGYNSIKSSKGREL